MSELKIKREGYQTWNDDFIEWENTYQETTEIPSDGTTFTGSCQLIPIFPETYRVFGVLSNPAEIDTTGDTALTTVLLDMSAYLTQAYEHMASQAIVINTTNYQATAVPIYFSYYALKLYVINGVTVPAGRQWYIDMTFFRQ